MQRFYALLLPVLFLTTLSFAQNLTKPGYVVTASGDTIRGAINYRVWDQTPTAISLRSIDGKTTTYNKNNARAFGIDGLEQFELHSLTLSMDEADPNKLKTHYDSTSLIGNVFLKLITKGEYLSLYSYADDIKTRFIVLPKDSKQPIELSRHLYMNQNTGAVTAIDRYKVELMTYAATYGKTSASLTALIQRSGYNSADLTKVINTMNGASAKTIATANKTGLRYFVGAAGVTAQVSYKGNTDLAYNSTNASTFLPQISIGADIVPNSATGRVVFRGELSAFAGTIKVVTATASKQMHITSINLHPQILFNIFNTAPAKIYVGAGAMMRVTSYSDIKFQADKPDYTVKEDAAKYDGIIACFPIRAGAIIANKFEVFGCYTPTSNFESNGYTLSTGKMSTMALGVSYLFGKK